MSDKPTDLVAEDTAPLKDGGSSFGSFFPKNYVLAVFPNHADGERAGAALGAAGFATEDVIVASGSDVAEHDAAVRSQQGLLSKLGEKWSRLYTDEAADADALMKLAQQGAAFVLAYAPEEADTERATSVLRPFSPPVFRKYDAMKVTELSVV
ncbi:MAG: hypothetical protein ABJB74_02440 [Gemmatimonas sp.]